MDINEIKQHLYNDNIDKALKYVSTICDEETLFIYANNYNWDNGFKIPEAILDNNVCTKNIALLIFNLANGIAFLEQGNEYPNLPAWHEFITKLYDRVISDEFPIGTIAFDPELSKVQSFKLKKILSPEQMIFITPIDGKECNILL